MGARQDRPRPCRHRAVRRLELVDNLKILFTPFLPFSSQRLHELLGHEGEIAGPPDSREHVDDDGTKYGVLTGDYEHARSAGGSRAHRPPGQSLHEPELLFKKLDPDKVVEEELKRMDDASRGDD